MQKYKVFSKLKKTKQCSYYGAEHIPTKQIVTIKKIKTINNWQQFINRKQISLMKQNKYKCLAKIREIIKQNENYYVIYDELGKNLLDVRNSKLDIQQIIFITKQLLKLILVLHKQNIVPEELRPEYFFLCGKQIKLVHLQPKYQIARSNLQLTELLDFKYSPPEIVLSNHFPGEISNGFSISCIISQLFLARTLIYAKTKLDYIYILCSLFPKQQLSKYKPQMKFSEGGTFEQNMKSVCSQYQLIKILEDMLKINYKQRLDIKQGLKKIQQLYEKKNFKPENLLAEIITKNRATTENSQNLNKPIKSSLSPSPKIKNPTDLGNKIYLSFNLNNQLTEDLTQLPSLPKFSKPLRFQRNITQLSKSIKRYPKINNKISLQQSKMYVTHVNNIRQKYNKTYSSKKRISTLQRQPYKLRQSKPQLTNYAINKNNKLGVDLKSISSFFSDCQQKDDKNLI